MLAAAAMVPVRDTADGMNARCAVMALGCLGSLPGVVRATG